MYQLNAKNGPLRGQTWTIQARPLLLGRSSECHVVVADTIVSRFHCSITLVDSEIHLSDLESENSTIVNGKSVEKSVLKIGDEISVGKATFLVSSAPDTALVHSGLSLEEPSLSIAETASIYLSLNEAEDDAGNHQTIREIANLFKLSRELTNVTSKRELVDHVLTRIQERYSPVSIRIEEFDSPSSTLHLRVEDGNFLGDSSEKQIEAAKIATTQSTGFIVSTSEPDECEDGIRQTLIAPMEVSGRCVGLIRIQTRPEFRSYSNDDLGYLLALAQTVAPFFTVVEQIEKLRMENELLRQESRECPIFIGESKSIQELREFVKRAAPTDLAVLILGATGVGKELVARMIHDTSSQSGEPFVVVNCAAIPAEMLESELFGYQAGAYTGALGEKAGLVEIAGKGTLFLDEVGDLSIENQAKLLRVIEARKFRRIGSNEEIRAEFRLVAATNKELPALIPEGKFRTDLYHRLNGIEIRVPALRERPSDIPTLAKYFFSRGLRNAKHPIKGIDQDAMAYLKQRPWPGNVRQLKNSVERAIALSSRDVLRVDDFRPASKNHDSIDEIVADYVTLEEAQKQYILRVLEACGGRIPEAAKILGIGRSTLYSKLSTHKIQI